MTHSTETTPPTITNPQPSIDQARAFIETLTGSPASTVTFQTFIDSKASSTTSSRPGIWHGTIDQHWQNLVEANTQGYGVFMMVNEGDLKGRTKANVVAVRAVFIDDDDGQDLNFERLKPTMVVRTKNGTHSYWRLNSGTPLNQFTEMQAALAKTFGTDPAVKDLPRVMRVPGFFHMKNPAEPFFVGIESRSDTSFDHTAVIAAYGLATQPTVTATAKPTWLPPTTSSTTPDKTFTFDAMGQARAEVEAFPPAIAGEGGDIKTYDLCCRLVRGYDLDENQALGLLASWNQRCSPPWTEDELRQKLQNADQYGAEERGSRLRERPPLLFMAPWDRYLPLFGDRYDINCSLSVAAARARLNDLGYNKDELKEAMAGGGYVLAYGVDCRPGQPQLFREANGAMMLNQYEPSTIVAKEGPWPVINDILTSVTGGDEAAIKWVFNWIAAKVQRPDRLMVTAVVLQGTQGNGKSKLALIVSHLMGLNNSASLTQNDLESNFNPFMERLFVVGNEIYSPENALHLSSVLKSYTADAFVSVNAKNRPQRQAKNRTGWMITSNSSTPVRVEGKHDRRWSVVSNTRPVEPHIKQGVAKMFTASEELTEYGKTELRGFLHALQQHVVDEVMIRQPLENHARRELAAASQGSVESFCETVSERGAAVMIEAAHICEPCGRSHPIAVALPIEGCFVRDTVYAAYCHFSHANGFKAMSAANFGKELKVYRLENGSSTAKSGSGALDTGCTRSRIECLAQTLALFQWLTN